MIVESTRMIFGVQESCGAPELNSLAEALLPTLPKFSATKQDGAAATEDT